jgi:integrase
MGFGTDATKLPIVLQTDGINHLRPKRARNWQSTMEHSCDHPTRMRLYNRANERLYINATERARFLRAASQTDPLVSSFCLTLLYTGCRISEALALRHNSVQAELRIVTIDTLKRRRADVCREVPMSRELVVALQEAHRLNTFSDQLIWNGVDRSTAYRWVKQVMAEANISGAKACPKGLRHGFGIQAVLSGVPLNLLQKWMGHASMTTTAIYADATGPEELAIADRMWRGKE